MPLDDKVFSSITVLWGLCHICGLSKTKWLQTHGVDLFAERWREEKTPLTNQADALLVIVGHNLGQL